MDNTTVTIKDTFGNPAPLGLLGFGLTTVLLNVHNAGLIEMSSMILGMGIFYGGLAQMIAGIMEWKKGNTFATTAMFIGTLRITRALQVVFGTLTILFFLLALGDFTGNTAILHFAGFEGIICGFTAIYAALHKY